MTEPSSEPQRPDLIAKHVPCLSGGVQDDSQMPWETEQDFPHLAANSARLIPGKNSNINSRIIKHHVTQT